MANHCHNDVLQLKLERCLHQHAAALRAASQRTAPALPSASHKPTSFLAYTGPTPRIMPDDRYFSMPSAEVGGEVRRKRALNCWPWVRSLTYSPEVVIHSPAEIVAAWPTTVTTSRWPRLGAQNAEAVLSVVIGHPLDELGKELPVTDSQTDASYFEQPRCGFKCRSLGQRNN
jgi:hypothetical protein